MRKGLAGITKSVPDPYIKMNTRKEFLMTIQRRLYAGAADLQPLLDLKRVCTTTENIPICTGAP